MNVERWEVRAAKCDGCVAVLGVQLEGCPSNLELRISHLAPRTSNLRGERGAVLLLVLWIVVAISFLALSAGLAVRTEIDSTRYRVEAERGKYLARGAIEQAMYLLNNPGLPGPSGAPIWDMERTSRITMRYATGSARVNYRSEAALLNVNTAEPERIFALLQITGLDPAHAKQITAAIVHWRSGAGDFAGELERYYATLLPPVIPARAPFKRVEELLLVRGITPEILYGWYGRDEQGRAMAHSGLARLVTVHGNGGQPSLNDSPWEVLMTVRGMLPAKAAAIVAGRARGRYRTMQDLPVILPPEVASQVSLSADSSVFSLEATGQPDGSPTQFSVRAVYSRDLTTGSLNLLAWYELTAADDTAFPPAMAPQAAGNAYEPGLRPAEGSTNPADWAVTGQAGPGERRPAS